ncbi:MAG: hypothetical protein U0625_08505 [Phycisphaerales bacterium]
MHPTTCPRMSTLLSGAALLAAASIACAQGAPPAAPPAPADGGGRSSFGAPQPAGAPAERDPEPPKPGAPPQQTPPAPTSGGVDHAKRAPAVHAAPGAVWMNDPTLLRLEHERSALELVDHASHQALKDCSRRIAAMHVFVEQQGLAGDYAKFIKGHVSHLDQLTFNEALERALAQTAASRPQPQTNDLNQIEQALEVEAGVARSSWNRLNQGRRTVAMMAEFLEGKGLLGFYQAWAPGFMRSKGWEPKGPAPGTAPDPDALRKRALQLDWDRTHRAQQAASQWQSAGAANPADVQSPDTAYPRQQPPQSGNIPSPVPMGPAPARSGYSNSWFNSYADPYYDMSGYPGRDPNLDPPRADDPATYGWAPEAYTYTGYTWPTFWDLGPNVVPGFSMFPGGAVGGVGFGGGRGGAVGGAAGGR